jgi:hypothetical protein
LFVKKLRLSLLKAGALSKTGAMDVEKAYIDLVVHFMPSDNSRLR